MHPSTVRRRLLLPLAALLIAPSLLAAQERQLFTWTGRVDRQVRLTMQGGRTDSDAERRERNTGRFRVVSDLPRTEGTVRVVASGGRGTATVLQHPTDDNDYEAIIRVADHSAGADRYVVTAYFTPGPRARRGRGRDDNRGRDDDRRRDDDDRRRNDDDDRRRNDDGRRRDGDWRRDGDNRRSGEPAVMRWSGMVDARAEIRWQGATVRQRALDGNALREVRSSISGNPGNSRVRQGAQVTLTRRDGRGDVDIVQQPSAANGYTTIVRINDAQGGYGRYSFEVAEQ